MIVKALCGFTDKIGGVFREVGCTFECDSERADELLKLNIVKEAPEQVEEAPEEPEEKPEEPEEKPEEPEEKPKKAKKK